jgi:hypothetical protein
MPSAVARLTTMTVCALVGSSTGNNSVFKKSSIWRGFEFKIESAKLSNAHNESHDNSHVKLSQSS